MVLSVVAGGALQSTRPHVPPSGSVCTLYEYLPTRLDQVAQAGQPSQPFVPVQRLRGATGALSPGALTYVPCCAQALVAVPDNMDDVLAAQAFVNPLTAIGIVDVRHDNQTEWLNPNPDLALTLSQTTPVC